MPERTILHVDMNNFYASVECMLDPCLRDKPIAVGGDVEKRHGIILAKNDKAKKYGVKTGEALWQAKAKCRDLLIVAPHYEQYRKYSRLAHQIYEEYTDQIEVLGIDECWLDVTGSRSIFGDGEKIANELRERIKFELGLTVSVGVSFNKSFAKLGSDMKKPDAVTVIPQESFREKIWELPVSDLFGVGRKTARKLAERGVYTIGRLAGTPESVVRSWFGVVGTELWLSANGMENSAVLHKDYEPPVKSVGHGITTPNDLTDNGEVWTVMLELSQDIGHRLKKCERRAQGVSIAIRDNQLNYKQWQCPLDTATNSSFFIAKTAYDLFLRSYRWNKPIRSVTVQAINLTSQSIPVQFDLFCDYKRIERQERLEDTIENIRERFGKHAVIPAALYNRDSMTPSEQQIEFSSLRGDIFDI